MSQKTPLHHAVLQERYDEIHALAKDPAYAQQVDAWGFTALELAQLLGKKQCLDLLLPNHASKGIKFILTGYKRTLMLTHQQFPATFGVRYLSHLRFPDYAASPACPENCDCQLSLLNVRARSC